MKLSATHAFNCMVLMVKFGWTSCEDIPPALLSNKTERLSYCTRVGVAYVNICISKCLKEKLGWAIDKWLRLIIHKMLFKTVIPLRN